MVDPGASHSGLLWPSGRERTYANHLAIAYDVSEVELCFGQGLQADGLTVPKSWIVTTPVHLVGFGRAISQALASYGDRYGRVPDDEAGEP